MGENIIVTIAIITHGSTISTNLTTEQSNIFENVRLLNYAGAMQKSLHSIDQQNQFIKILKEDFQKDLLEPTANIIEKYGEKLYPTAKENHKDSNVCRIFENISYDKIIGKLPNNNKMFCIPDWLNPDIMGIFLHLFSFQTPIFINYYFYKNYLNMYYYSVLVK